MNRIELCQLRLTTEEGLRLKPYNDATGKTVTCKPDGNLTWLYGCNLETSGSVGLAKVVLNYQLTDFDRQLSAFTWYQKLDEPRGSVFLDVGFNDGVVGMLHFPKCIAAAAIGDWGVAHLELLDSDAARADPHRYNPLADILLTGNP